MQSSPDSPTISFSWGAEGAFATKEEAKAAFLQALGQVGSHLGVGWCSSLLLGWVDHPNRPGCSTPSSFTFTHTHTPPFPMPGGCDHR